MRTAPPAVGAAPGRDGCDFSLYFFGDYPDEDAGDKYQLIQEAARFADRNGFHSLWLPERHFHSFGALFPNPSVLAAALAAQTSTIRLHAGSVVLPLHNPLRVAEEWAVVDNLSGGRVGIGVASGWHADDFALAPENYGNHRELMYERVDTVRRLWAGEAVPMLSGSGEQTELRTHPRPLQAQPPMFVAVVGNPDSYRRAAAEDMGVVTNLMAQSVEDLAGNIALYRRTRAEHGLDPDGGRVVVLLHTYLDADPEAARREAFEPFISYLRSSLSLFNQVTNSLGVDIDLDHADPDDVRFLLEQAYGRYCEDRALIGDVAGSSAVVERLRAVGADEIACFVDFGVPTGHVLAGLTELDALRRRHARGATPTRQADTTPGASDAVPALPEQSSVALSPAQRRIWFLEQLEPGRTSYHEPKTLRFDGPLDTDALLGALQQVVDRHPALRSVVTEVEGEPRLTVRDRMPLPCPLTDAGDLPGVADGGRDEESLIAQVLAEELREPIDLATGPLLKARLVRFAPERHVLLLVAHHVVFDSSSTQILTRDLAAWYRSWPQAPAELPELPAHTPVDEPGEREHDEALRYWLDRLADAPETALPTDRPRPARSSGTGGHLVREWPAATAEDVRTAGAGASATVFSVLLGAVCVALRRLGGADDMVVGTALMHRPDGAEDAVGMYVETLPLRVDLADDPTFGSLARELTTAGLDAYQYRAAPFDELVAALNPDRTAGGNPLFQVAVEFENATGDAPFAPPELSVTTIDLAADRAAPVDLALYLTHGTSGVRCLAEYDRDLFDAATVERLLDYVDLVLAQLPAAPDARLSDLPALTAADREVIEGATRTPAAPAVGREPGSLHGVVLAQARRTPDAVALVHGERSTTYGELDDRSSGASAALRARGVNRGDLVAVCLPRGAEFVLTLLAVLRAGAVYLPIDPELPAARRRSMIEDSGAVLLVATPATAEGAAPDATPVADVASLSGADGGSRHEGAGPEPVVGPEDLAYCIYTSGSTGRPKGVEVPHRGPVNLIRWDLAAHGPQDTLQWSSASFDAAVMEIFTTLGGGARLVLLDESVRHDPAALVTVMRRDRVARLFMPFTPLRYLMESRPELPALRSLISAGEPTGDTPALSAFLTAHPDCTLFNMYGPTEGSVCATSHRVTPGDAAPPIGRPIAGTEARLLGADGTPVPVGARGEIHLAGAGVAAGYRGRPAETAAAFLPDPENPGALLYRTGDLARLRADGELEYVGRVDHQVKIRGHRVEPAEARRALAALPGVRDAAVAVRDDSNGEPQLVGWVVPEDDADTGLLDRLPGLLAAELPTYLVPSRWARVAALPLNSSGKLDEARLPDPVTTGTVTATPEGPLEEALYPLWREELGCGDFDVTRGFFDLGGHSLSAVRLLHRVRATLGREVSLAELFRAPSVRALAAVLTAEDATGPTADTAAAAAAPACPGGGKARQEVPRVTGATAVETAPLTSAQRRMVRRHRAHGRPEALTMGLRVDVTGPLDVDALRAAFAQVVARHPALRTRIVPGRSEGRPGAEEVQEVSATAATEVEVTELPDDSAAVARWCDEAVTTPFALDEAPLLRVRLGRLGERRWILALAAHHAVGDGWSLHLVWNDVAALYRAAAADEPVDLPEPGLPYPDFARREERESGGDRWRDAAAHWREALAGAPLETELPTERERPARLSGAGALHRFRVDAETARGLRSVGETAGGTLHTALVAGVGQWLARLADEESVVVALSSARRTRPGDETVVGYVGEAVPVRLGGAATASFPELVRHTGERLFEALDHEVLPLAEIWQAASPTAEPLLAPRVMVTVMTGPAPEASLAGLTTRTTPLTAPGAARTELYVVLSPETDGFAGVLEYSTDLFSAETVGAWAKELTALLEVSAGVTDH
ncbi:MupA/Atu3671 family FMN-dependent luciferase-like monooxygenase [Streptomyces spiramenti]|uniref:MupA/Atu3671 family FMN-dependent luciferase-like monooxygenase n=1 Tax=Streptomyces spiramenti TaxID=2720606 RepID=UPI0030846377